MAKKGMSLPIETIVIIVIAVIVLVVLLLFFSGSVNPGIDRIKLEGERVDLCSKYVTNDKECRGQPSGDALKLNEVCSRLGTPDARLCCSSFCPLITTKAQCEAARGGCEASCGQGKNEIGRCNDEIGTPVCCRASV